MLAKQATCDVCATVFWQETEGQIRCSARCVMEGRKRKKNRNEVQDRECVVCRGIFRSSHTNAKCCSSTCSAERERQLKRQTAHAKTAADLKTNQAAMKGQAASHRRSGIPCVACKHWKPQPAGVYGGECVIAFWNRCTPLKPGAVPLVPVNA